jgi:hypothetical protein
MLLSAGHPADAQVLSPETVLVTAAGAPAATQETFSIGTATDLIVTFTDLQTPSPLSGATVAVTQGASLVGTTTLAAGATTATLAVAGAVGQYTLRVIGTANAAAAIPAGSFTVCVAPRSAPTACIADASTAGTVAAQSTPANPTVSTLALTLTVTTPGAYTFSYQDDQFPVALNIAPTLALFQGSTPFAVPVPASPAVLTLSAGTYTLLAFAKADPTVQAGLYGITVAGPVGVAPLVDGSYAAGLLAPASQATNPSAQSVTLSVTDFAFPTALTNASAALTSGGSFLGTASTVGGAATVTALMGPLQVWSYGIPNTGAGTFEVGLAAGATSLLQADFGVNSGGALAYAIRTPAVQAGALQATGNDFQFPSALTALRFAVAQNGAVLKTASAAGTIDFTAAAAPAVLLVAATPVANGSGLVDVNIQTTGNSPQLLFDQVQPVSSTGGFTSLPISLHTSGNYVVTLTDLDFPAQFGTLALVGSSSGAVLGNIYGGGTFPVTATPGDYQFTIVAIPAAQQQYGLYGLQIVDAPPTLTLSASPTSVTTGATTTLSWTATNSTSCTGSGGTFAGSQTAGSGSVAVVVSATTTYSLSCTGPGGSIEKTVTVTATPAVAKSGGGGGGGSIGLDLAAALGLLVLVRLRAVGGVRPAG